MAGSEDDFPPRVLLVSRVHQLIVYCASTVVPTNVKETVCCQMPEELSSIFVCVTPECRCLNPCFLGSKKWTVDTCVFCRKLLDMRAVFSRAWKTSEEKQWLDWSWIMWGTTRGTCTRAMTVRKGSRPGSARKGSDHACSGHFSIWSTVGSRRYWLSCAWKHFHGSLILFWSDLSVCKASVDCTLNAPKEVTKSAVG